MVLSKIFDRSIQEIGHVEFTKKVKSAVPREQNYAAWLVKNGKTVFSKLTRKGFFCQDQASRQASAQPAVFLSQNFRYFPALLVVIIVKYPALIFLGKFLMDIEQVITEVLLIFTEVWPCNFDVSW